ncbi:hypothetical protein [Sulfurimonas sp.]|uniref:hypothetical protein n=1 Tax=Sulfurimonas sp. TaxID=2022749 RepID=UPI0025D668CE|nr:hypothetical protein [Sulfurimonas sp.]
MLGIGTALVGMGLGFVKDLIMDNGEDLVKEGIKKVTGIDLSKKKPQELTSAEIQKINDYKLDIQKLNFEELKLELDAQKEQNRHEEAKYNKAHETYQNKGDMGDKIAEQIIKRNLPIIGILVIVNVLLVYFLKDSATLIAIASNIIGITIGNLFAERQAIVNFFFGSSIGSKDKDKQLHKTQGDKR